MTQKIRKVLIYLFIFSSILGFSNCQFSKKTKLVSLEFLLNEMTDRTIIAEYPDPFFLNKQFSSYDQNSIGPDKDGWFANHDCSWFIREENNSGRKEYVMFDADGPGAVVRFWMTFAGEGSHDGILRFYIDGAKDPVIEGNAMKIISGGGLVGEPLSSSVSPDCDYNRRGHNLYFPIPYAKNCKITYENDAVIINENTRKPSIYYNINYRTYEENTEVISYSDEELLSVTDLLAEVQNKLESRDRGLSDLNLSKIEFDKILPAGEENKITINGKKAIRKLSFRINAKDREQALRSTVLEIWFDGERKVWSPVGDFFGTGYNIRPFSTWYNEVKADGTMASYWTMPFKKSCEIKLNNYGNQDVTIELGEVEYSSYKWTKNSMFFGAVWHEYTAINSAGSSYVDGDDKHFDINFSSLTGEGVYAGDALTLFNTAYAWWGEGDEKVYVDGEYFPSHIGTGTEDYYGYAWCRPEKFDHFLIAQPDGSGNFEPGFTLNMRYRILDGIPFTKSLKFDMELWHWASTIMNYAPISYWYLKPGGKCNVEISPETVMLPVVKEKTDLIKPVPGEEGVMEGERMIVLESSGGNPTSQSSSMWNWSQGGQLWWMDAKPDDYIILEFIMKEAGEYFLEGNFTKANDYGNFIMEINDDRWNSSFNGYNEKVTTEKIDLGTFKILEGANKIKISLTGKDQKAHPRYMVGIDYIKLVKKL